MFPGSWQVLSIAVSVLATAILFAALAAPLWIWMDDGDEYVGIGLFYRIGFESDGTVTIPEDFVKIKFDSDQTIDTTHWIVMMSMEIASTLMALILIILLIAFRYRAKAAKDIYGIFRACLWVSIITWVLNGVGLVVFIIYHGDILTEGPDINAKSFSWGGLICACAFLLHVFLTLIIFQCIWPDGDTVIPASADPKMSMFPSTTNGNLSQVFQSYYNTNVDKPPMENNGGDNFGQGQNTRLPSMPQSQNFSAPEIPDRRMVPYIRPRSPPPILEDRRRPSTDARRVSAIYGNMGHAPVINNQPSFDNPGFGLDRQDIQRHTTTTILDRQGGRYDEEVVFRRIQPDPIDQRTSVYRGFNNVNETRKHSRDFLVTAKHSADNDVHRDTARYMSHTSKPSDQSNQNQRLVLSPSNFTDSNVKYNPSYIYRPFSETVY